MVEKTHTVTYRSERCADGRGRYASCGSGRRRDLSLQSRVRGGGSSCLQGIITISRRTSLTPSGRALDTAPPALYTLMEINKICPEILKKCEIYIDGGVRRGTDVVKAVCLGAKGVGLGRPFLYSLTYGKEGVIHGIESE